jgi:hypothetical protein
MANSNFDSKKLSEIYRLLTPSDIAGSLKLPYSIRSNPTAARGEVEFLISALMNVDGRGAYSGSSLIKMMKTRSSILKNLMSVTTTVDAEGSVELQAYNSDADYKNSIGQAGSSPPKSLKLSAVMGAADQQATAGMAATVILCETPLVNPQIRDAHLVSTFLCTIPTHVMSLAVPYLNVEFSFNRSPISEGSKGDYRPRAPSALRFLLGAEVNSSMQGSANKAMASSLYALRSQKDKSGQLFPVDTSTMDIFCSPQTMTNFDDIGRGNRANSVLDPTRPFASIESFTVNVIPTVGFMTYKTAVLTFKVHDRSRLVDIADLIRPADFSDATCWIQYGWKTMMDDSIAQDGLGGYSELISSMMTSPEAYGVKNMSLATDATGQITVNLELYTKSAMFASKFNIVFQGVDSVLHKMTEAVNFVRSFRESLGLGKPTGVSKEMRIHQLMDSAADGMASDMSTEDLTKALNELKALVDVKSTNVAVTQKLSSFIDSVEKLTTKDGRSFKEKIKESLKSNLQKKMAELKKSDPWLPLTPESPFYAPVKRYLTLANDKDDPYVLISEGKNPGGYFNPSETAKETEGKGKTPSRVRTTHGVCSLAKLMSVFLLEPMQNIDHEVQLIFYTFNDDAGWEASAKNIGRFPIEVDVFIDSFFRHLVSLGKGMLTIEEFIGFVCNTILNDNFSLGYGLREYYEPYDGSTGHALKEVSSKTEKNPGKKKANENVKSYESEVMKFAQVRGTQWRTPIVECQIETLTVREDDPTKKSADTSTGASTSKKQLTRIHIFDKQAAPWKEAAAAVGTHDAYAVMKDSSELFKKLGKETPQTQYQVISALKTQKVLTPEQWAANAGSTSLIPEKFMTLQKYKDIVARLVPTLKYGTNASGISSAVLSTKADSLVSTVNMTAQKQAPQNNVHPNGSGAHKLPVQVMPATLSMTVFGCPRMCPPQVYFIDFNTGTSMDNLYILTTVTHTISPGKFDTQLQLSYNEGYAKFYSPTDMSDALMQELKYITDPKKSQ